MAGLPGEGSAFGRYDIGRRIGRGGMGVVYEATHRDLMRPVALKLLSMDLLDDEALRNRFIREAQALAAVDSDHIVPVFDAGEHEGWLYIATKLFLDGDLGAWIGEHGALSQREALSVLVQVADGLADAHRAGFLHRDIKPSNILLQKRVDGLRAVICDFGIAFAEGNEHTKTVGVIGTLGYMAPERHEGRPATIASDIYSLGCVLYACLTGRAPWNGTDVKVAMGHLYEPVPQLVEGPARLNEILARALAKDPAERFSSAAELKAALIALDDVDDRTVVTAFTPEALSAAEVAHEPVVADTLLPPVVTPVPEPDPEPDPEPMPGPPVLAETVLKPVLGEGAAAEVSPPVRDAGPPVEPIKRRRGWRMWGVAAAAVAAVAALAVVPFVIDGDGSPGDVAADTPSPNPTTSAARRTPTLEEPDAPTARAKSGDLSVDFTFSVPTTSRVYFEYVTIRGSATSWQRAYGGDASVRTAQGGKRACVYVRAIAFSSSLTNAGPTKKACGTSRAKTLTLKLSGACSPAEAECTEVTLRATGLRRNSRFSPVLLSDGQVAPKCTFPSGREAVCFSGKADASGTLVEKVNWRFPALLSVQAVGLKAEVRVP